MKNPDKPKLTYDNLFDNLKPTSNEFTTGDLEIYGLNTNLGKSQYDKLINPDVELNYDNLFNSVSSNRAQHQPWTHQLGNAAGRLVNIIPEAIGGIASALDFEDYVNTDNEVGNWLTSMMEDWKEATNEALPIYRENPGQALDWSDSGWWFENASSLINSIGGFAISGGAISKGLQGLSKATKAYKIAKSIMGANAATKAGQIAHAGITSTMLNQSEGILEAMDVYEYTYNLEYNKLLNEGINEKTADLQSRQKAADAASIAIKTNRANILLNLTSANLFLKTPMLSRKVLKAPSTKSNVTKGIFEGFQESGEEFINLVASERGKAFGRGDDYTVNSVLKNINAPEAIEAALLGFIGGIGQTVATTEGINRLSKTVDPETGETISIREMEQRQFDRQQEDIKNYNNIAKEANVKDFTNVFNNALDNFKINIAYKEAIENEDYEEAERLASLSLGVQSYKAFQNGTTENLIKLYEELRDGEQKEGMGSDYKEKANHAINSIKNLEKFYNFSADYTNSKEVYLNKVNEYDLQTEYDNALQEKNKAIALVNDKINHRLNYKRNASIKDSNIDYYMLSDSSDNPKLQKFKDNFRKQPEFKEAVNAVKKVQEIESKLEENEKEFLKLTSDKYQKKYKEKLEKANEAAKKILNEKKEVKTLKEDINNIETLEELDKVESPYEWANNEIGELVETKRKELIKKKKEEEDNIREKEEEYNDNLKKEEKINTNNEEKPKRNLYDKFLDRTKKRNKVGDKTIIIDVTDKRIPSKFRGSEVTILDIQDDKIVFQHKDGSKYIAKLSVENNKVDNTAKIADIEKRRQEELNSLKLNETTNQQVNIRGDFFLSTPNSDGSFNESSQFPSFKDGASIYRFEKNGNKARFIIDDSRQSAIKLALQYPDRNIEPVSNANNAYDPKVETITTVKAGEAELINGKWVVTKEAEIYYGKPVVENKSIEDISEINAKTVNTPLKKDSNPITRNVESTEPNLNELEEGEIDNYTKELLNKIDDKTEAKLTNEEEAKPIHTRIIITDNTRGSGKKMFDNISDEAVEFERNPVSKIGQKKNIEVGKETYSDEQAKAVKAFNKKDFSDLELLYNHLPLNIKLTDSISVPLETLPNKKYPKAQDTFNKTSKILRKAIIKEIALEKTDINDLQLEIAGQYNGEIQLDGTNENNIADLYDFQNDLSNITPDLLYVATTKDLIENINGENIAVNKKAIGRGEVYIKIKTASGVDFPLKLNVKRNSEDVSQVLYDIYKYYIENDLAQDDNVLISDLPQELQNNIDKVFEKEIELYNKNKIPRSRLTIRNLIDVIVWDGTTNSKTKIKFAKNNLILGDIKIPFSKIKDNSAQDTVKEFFQKLRQTILFKPDEANPLNLGNKSYIDYLISNNILNTNAKVNEHTFAGRTTMYIDVSKIYVNGKNSKHATKPKFKPNVRGSAIKLETELRNMYSNELTLDEESKEFYTDKKGIKHDRVSNLKNKGKKVNPTTSMEIGGKRGDVIDNTFRDFFKKAMTYEEFEQVFKNHIININKERPGNPIDFEDSVIEQFYDIALFYQDLFDRMNWTVYSVSKPVGGKIATQGAYGGYVAGSMDFLVYDNVNKKWIDIDIKTNSESTSRIDIYNGVTQDNYNYKQSDLIQQNAYAELFYQQNGIKLDSLFILPITLDNRRDGDVIVFDTITMDANKPLIPISKEKNIYELLGINNTTKSSKPTVVKPFAKGAGDTITTEIFVPVTQQEEDEGVLQIKNGTAIKLENNNPAVYYIESMNFLLEDWGDGDFEVVTGLNNIEQALYNHNKTAKNKLDKFAIKEAWKKRDADARKSNNNSLPLQNTKKEVKESTNPKKAVKEIAKVKKTSKVKSKSIINYSKITENEAFDIINKLMDEATIQELKDMMELIDDNQKVKSLEKVVDYLSSIYTKEELQIKCNIG